MALIPQVKLWNILCCMYADAGVFASPLHKACMCLLWLALVVLGGGVAAPARRAWCAPAYTIASLHCCTANAPGRPELLRVICLRAAAQSRGVACDMLLAQT